MTETKGTNATSHTNTATAHPVPADWANKLETIVNTTITFLYEGEEYKPGQSLGRITSGKVRVTVSSLVVQGRFPIVGYSDADKGGNHTEDFFAPTKVEDAGEGNALLEYSFDLEISNGVPHYPDSRFYLLCEGKNDTFWLWTAGLFLNDHTGEILCWLEYATHDVVGKAKEEGGEIVLGKFAGSQGWAKFVGKLVEDGPRFDALPIMPQSTAPARAEVPEIMNKAKIGSGVVQWYNPFQRQGYAWIMTNDGIKSIKIHGSQLPPDEHGIQYIKAETWIRGWVQSRVANQGRSRGQSILELRDIHLVPAESIPTK